MEDMRARAGERKCSRGGTRYSSLAYLPTGSVPNRPVQTIVRTIGRQSGQSGSSFRKPRPVRLEPQKPTDA